MEEELKELQQKYDRMEQAVIILAESFEDGSWQRIKRDIVHILNPKKED